MQKINSPVGTYIGFFSEKRVIKYLAPLILIAAVVSGFCYGQSDAPSSGDKGESVVSQSMQLSRFEIAITPLADTHSYLGKSLKGLALAGGMRLGENWLAQGEIGASTIESKDSPREERADIYEVDHKSYFAKIGGEWQFSPLSHGVFVGAHLALASIDSRFVDMRDSYESRGENKLESKYRTVSASAALGYRWIFSSRYSFRLSLSKLSFITGKRQITNEQGNDSFINDLLDDVDQPTYYPVMTIGLGMLL